MKFSWRHPAVALAAVAAVAGLAAVAACGAASASPSQQASHTVSVPADGRSRATLWVVTGTSTLRIGVAKIGALLLVSTPAGGPAPRPRDDGDVVYLSAPGASTVTVTLNAAVRWQLELAGGTTRTLADLRGGQVTAVTIAAGSDIIDLALPAPHGSVPVRLTAGASQFLLSLPGGAPARLTAGGGAGEVSLEGLNYVGVAGGSVFSTPGWTPGGNGFDIDATAGAARIVVTARAG